MSTDNKPTLEYYKTSPENLKLSDNYDVLVLSGGGLKGIIHLGMIHALNNATSEKLRIPLDSYKATSECNEDSVLNYLLKDVSITHHHTPSFPNSIKETIPFKSPVGSIHQDTGAFKYFVGTSIGSVICFLLIIGLSPVEILSHICSKDYSDDAKIDLSGLLSKCGVTTFESFFDEILKTTENKIGFIPTMSELYETFNKEFVCVTHNMTTDETVYIDHISHPNLSCIEALKMSCNVPLLFEKYMYDKCCYIDGAASDNFPIEYAKNRYNDKKILGLYIETSFTRIRENKDDDLLSYLKVLLTLSVRMNCRKSKLFKAENTDIIMATINESFPEWKFNMTSSSRFALFSIGYNIIENIRSQDMINNSTGTSETIQPEASLQDSIGVRSLSEIAERVSNGDRSFSENSKIKLD